MILSIHWPTRHVTNERAAALQAVLAAHPGPDAVEVHLTGVVARLVVTVDTTAPALRREITEACEVQGHGWVYDPEQVWP